MRKVSESDIQIEADIHALANNPNGFEEGAWIPYLVVKYGVPRIGGDHKVAGDFMPMIANDVPHSHFGRHSDRATCARDCLHEAHAARNNSALTIRPATA